MTSNALTDKAPYQHGVQCCGGTVSLLFEPLRWCPPSRSSVSVTSAWSSPGSWRDTTSSCTWSTPGPSSSPRPGSRAWPTPWHGCNVHRLPVLPEIALGELPPGAHILVMTHDHAEDMALCDALLRSAGDPGDGGSVRRGLGLDRVDRLVGQVVPVSPGAGRERSPAGGDRSDHHPDRVAGTARQGACGDRGQRRGESARTLRVTGRPRPASPQRAERVSSR